MYTPALIASAGGDRVRFVGAFEASSPDAHAFGPALTVRGAPGDNLALHLAVDEVAPGELIVLDADGSTEAGLCGDLLALAAQTRGAAGLVVNGAIRDRAGIAELGFPVFHRGISPLNARKAEPGELRVPVLGIEPGDFVAADADGVVVVAARHVDEVLSAAERLAAMEHEHRAHIRAGESTLDVLGLRRR